MQHMSQYMIWLNVKHISFDDSLNHLKVPRKYLPSMSMTHSMHVFNIILIMKNLLIKMNLKIPISSGSKFKSDLIKIDFDPNSIFDFVIWFE